MPQAFADLQGDIHYILTTPNRSEVDQMIEDFGKKQKNNMFQFEWNEILELHSLPLFLKMRGQANLRSSHSSKHWDYYV